MRAQLETDAASAEDTGRWLGEAMTAGWSVAERLLDFPELADVLGERHEIIANDWQNAGMLQLIGRQLRRANAILARVDFSTDALRADLAGERRAPRYLFAAAELIDQAADLAASSAVLVHRNERKWRVFLARVQELTG
jgi:hypothetical protein